jgi:hypothetical protein
MGQYSPNISTVFYSDAFDGALVTPTPAVSSAPSK